MIHYRDMCFCSLSNTLGGSCKQTACHRYLSKEAKTHAVKIGLPIAQADMFDDENQLCLSNGDVVEKIKENK